MEFTVVVVFCGFVVLALVFVVLIYSLGMREKSFDEVVAENQKMQSAAVQSKVDKGSKDKKKKQNKKSKGEKEKQPSNQKKQKTAAVSQPIKSAKSQEQKQTSSPSGKTKTVTAAAAVVVPVGKNQVGSVTGKNQDVKNKAVKNPGKGAQNAAAAAGGGGKVQNPGAVGKKQNPGSEKKQNVATGKGQNSGKVETVSQGGKKQNVGLGGKGENAASSGNCQSDGSTGKSSKKAQKNSNQQQQNDGKAQHETKGGKKAGGNPETKNAEKVKNQDNKNSETETKKSNNKKEGGEQEKEKKGGKETKVDNKQVKNENSNKQVKNENSNKQVKNENSNKQGGNKGENKTKAEKNTKGETKQQQQQQQQIENNNNNNKENVKKNVANQKNEAQSKTAVENEINKSKNENNMKKEVSSLPPSPTKKAKKARYDFGGGDNGMNGMHLATVLRNAILTDSELQTLIDILLNRQQEGESWVKLGQKIDPISSLKKQLQETEQKLADEQLLSQTTSNKLKEIRQEHNKCIQLERAAREKVGALQQELQNMQLHYQHVHDQHLNEINGMKMKFQQVQVKTNEEHRMTVQRLQEDSEKLQQALAQVEANAKNMSSNEIPRLKCELDQWRITCEQYKEQLATSQQSESECEQRVHQLQQCIQDLNSNKAQQEKVMQQEINDLIKQLNQMEANQVSLKRDLCSQQNVQAENASLHSQILDLEKTNNNYCQTVQDLKEKLHVAEMEIQDYMNEKDAKQQEIQHELDHVRKAKELLQMKLDETTNDMQSKESLLAKQQNDLARYLDEVQQLSKELDVQRDKNNKVSNLLVRIFPDCDLNPNDDFNSWLKKVEAVAMKSQSWANLEEELRISKQEAQENEKTLTVQVQHYKDVLRDTESMLNSLQRRVEDEELTWKEKLLYKENDLKQIEERIEELQGKLLIEENERKLAELKSTEAYKTLQSLEQHLDEKNRQYAELQSREAMLENRICELENDMKSEKKTIEELLNQKEKLNILVHNNEDALRAEQELVRELRSKIVDQKSLAATANGMTNDTINDAV